MLSTNPNLIKVKEGETIEATTVRMIIDQEIDLLVETETEVHLLEVEVILVEFTDQIIGVDHRMILDKIIDRTITGEITYRTIIEITLGKTVGKKDIEIQELKIETVVEMDVEIITEAFQERILTEVEVLVETEVERDSHIQEIEERKIGEIVID